MRVRWKPVLLLAAAAMATTAGGVGAAPPSPSTALKAKRAQAQSVLAQVNQLDMRSGQVIDAWDGARLQLAATEHQLALNRVALTRAERQSRVAEQRLARRIVAIYEHGQPSVAEILAGATSLSQAIDGLEYSNAVASADKRIAAQAKQTRNTLAAARVRLREAERVRRATVVQLGVERRQIESMLAERSRLLASIRGQIATLQAQEAARQRELAAEARARLAHLQELARERAAAQAAAARAAAAQRAQTTTTTATPVAPPTGVVTPDPTTTTGTTTSAPPTTTAPAPPPISTVGPGHPEAAQIALKYLGIPYQWGGSTPATGFDCSGLVMYVYAQLGIQLPHYAAAQYGFGTAVSRDQLQPGDLVFFDGLGHVGIYIGGGEMVHAPHTGAVVEISPISEFGGRYVGARRL